MSFAFKFTIMFKRFTEFTALSNNSLVNQSQVLDNTQRLQHQRIGLFNRTAATTMPAKYKTSSFASVCTVPTEYVRDIVAVLARFTMKCTHENNERSEKKNGLLETCSSTGYTTIHGNS